MYIKIGSEFADAELSYLAEVCSMLDEKIKIDYDKIKATRDVDIDGAGDHSEYLIGLGFTAMQRYLWDVLDMSKISKHDVLKLGNKFSSEFSIAEIINHAANWWKHEPEWTMIAFDEKELTSNTTINAVLEHAEYPYALSNILYEYVLTRKEKHLNIRAFTDNQKREAYERQHGICPVCNDHFDITEMEADHITPWHLGGKTSAANCQMLCKEDNRRKSGK